MIVRGMKLTLGPLILVGAGCGEVKLAGPENIANGGTIEEAGSLPLTDHLVTIDKDTGAPALVYTIHRLPEHGTLIMSGEELGLGARFTQKDIDDGVVTYVHDGSETTEDGFEWVVSDGASQLPATGTSRFEVEVTPVNDAPMVVNNSVPDLPEGGTYVLTSADLMASDPEGDPITFTVGAFTRGVIERETLDGFEPLAEGDTFTPEDIESGRIRIVDSGDDDAQLAMQQSTTASFSWSVSDDQEASADHETTFTVTPVDDPPTVSFHTSRCYRRGIASAANPLSAPLADPDNLASDYQVCVVSIGTGSSAYVITMTTTYGGTTTYTTYQTQIAVSLRHNGTVLTAGSCVPADTLGGLTFTSQASTSGGTITWKLMKGTETIGAHRAVNFTPDSSCPISS